MKKRVSVMLNDESVISVEECQKRGIKANDVLGIVVQTPSVGIVVSTEERQLPWGHGYLITSEHSEIEGLAIETGLEHTRAIAKAQMQAGSEETAAMYCWNYNKGGKQWYMPSMRELTALVLCKEEFYIVCVALGLTPLASALYWSSTESTANNAWGLYGNGSCHDPNDKNYTYYVRSVFAYQPLTKAKLMDYEKKYESALERARDVLNKEYVERATMEYLFPKLKESEDECIRRALCRFVHDTTSDELWVNYKVHKAETLAWLEKQRV